MVTKPLGVQVPLTRQNLSLFQPLRIPQRSLQQDEARKEHDQLLRNQQNQCLQLHPSHLHDRSGLGRGGHESPQLHQILQSESADEFLSDEGGIDYSTQNQESAVRPNHQTPTRVILLPANDAKDLHCLRIIKWHTSLPLDLKAYFYE